MSAGEHPLEFLFHPRSIAIVGASTMPGPGSSFLTAIQEMGYQGQLYPVNPRADEIQGLKCYPRLLEVPGEVDYVISSVPAPIVPQLLDDCGPRRVKAIHFFTAGFSETGEAERVELEEQLRRRTREMGVRVIGPNCMGLFCPETGLSVMPGLPTEPGPVAMISQSGANAGDFCHTGATRGLRYSKVISYGNALDLDESDFLEYCGQDPKTEVIVAYIEGVKDGQRFLAALRAAAAAKPVIIVKGGRTEAGGRATVSHTGSLAGALRVFDAACHQAGALRVDDMDELMDCAVAFLFVRRMPGPRLAIVGVGGGNSVLAADAVAAIGLEVPALPEKTQRALAEFTPIAGTSVRNPVDTNVVMGPDGAQHMRETLRLLAESPNIDLILSQAILSWGPGQPGEGLNLAEHARQAAVFTAEAMEAFGKPVVAVARTLPTSGAMDAVTAFQEEAATRGLATFSSVPRAAYALRRLLDWQALRE